MAIDAQVQNVLEKKNGGLTDRGMVTGVTQFRMVAGGLSELSSGVTWEIRWPNKNQLLHGIERLPGRWRAHILHEEDHVEEL